MRGARAARSAAETLLALPGARRSPPLLRPRRRRRARAVADRENARVRCPRSEPRGLDIIAGLVPPFTASAPGCGGPSCHALATQRWVASAPGCGGPSCHALASGTLGPRTPSDDRRRGGAAASWWSDPAARPRTEGATPPRERTDIEPNPVVTGDGARFKAPGNQGSSSGILERHRLPAERLQRGPHPPGLGVVLHPRRRQPGERSRAYGRVGLAHEYGSREHGRSASGGAVAASRAAAAA